MNHQSKEEERENSVEFMQGCIDVSHMTSISIEQSGQNVATLKIVTVDVIF